MWNVLLASAVAGSTGFIAKRLLTPHNIKHVDNINGPISNASSYDSDTSLSDSETPFGNRVFVFSTSESLNHRQSGGSHNGVWVPNVERRNKGGKRLPPFCYNKTKSTNKVLVEKVPTFSSKDDSLSSALGLGIVYMMMAEKAEINKLHKTMKRIAVSVQELKSDLDRRKSSCAHRKLDSGGDFDSNSCKMRGEHGEVTLKKTNTEFGGNDVKIWSPFVRGSGECESSALTEEPELHVHEMNQLEAELEFELQKLSGCTIDTPCHEETRPKFNEGTTSPCNRLFTISKFRDHETAVQLEVEDKDCNRIYVPNFNYSHSHGVLASELNQRLSELLIKQQENQISELEFELHLAQSNLQQKEAEIQALKDSVKCLTELSLSTVSDDETLTLTDPKGINDLDNNNMFSFSKQSLVEGKKTS